MPVLNLTLRRDILDKTRHDGYGARGGKAQLRSAESRA